MFLPFLDSFSHHSFSIIIHSYSLFVVLSTFEQFKCLREREREHSKKGLCHGSSRLIVFHMSINGWGHWIIRKTLKSRKENPESTNRKEERRDHKGRKIEMVILIINAFFHHLFLVWIANAKSSSRLRIVWDRVVIENLKMNSCRLLFWFLYDHVFVQIMIRHEDPLKGEERERHGFKVNSINTS